MTKDEKKKDLCPGCYCNDYNYGLGGAEECFSLKTAKVVKRKFVHVDQKPPWNQPAEKTLSCHQKQRYISVRPGVTC